MRGLAGAGAALRGTLLLAGGAAGGHGVRRHVLGRGNRQVRLGHDALRHRQRLDDLLLGLHGLLRGLLSLLTEAAAETIHRLRVRSGVRPTAHYLRLREGFPDARRLDLLEVDGAARKERGRYLENAAVHLRRVAPGAQALGQEARVTALLDL